MQLDGTNNTQRIQDTDRGVWDGNSHYDVAMGPFQFIPETWRLFGVDANGDGRVSPDNIDDAAVAAGRYLCFNRRDLAVPREWQQAILSYNRSMKYVKAVYRAAYAYGEVAAALELSDEAVLAVGEYRCRSECGSSSNVE